MVGSKNRNPFDINKLKFHYGPIDQKALTNMDPVDLMMRIEIVLKEMKLQLETVPNDPFKFKVLQLQEGKKRKDTSVALASLPQALFEKVKLVSQFGLSYNHGYNGKTSQTNAASIGGEPVKMYVMVHRIGNLEGLYTVDLKRKSGDIWTFRSMYTQIIERLGLKMSV